MLLGAIIEKVSGKSYADFVRERIFQPLGMADTRYDVTDAVIPRRASGYAPAKGGIVNAAYLSMTQPYAAGSLVSTVDDLAKWDAGLGAGKVVSTASLEKMFTSYRLASGAACGYGYGWQIGEFAGHPSRNMAAASTDSVRTSSASRRTACTPRFCRISRGRRRTRSRSRGRPRPSPPASRS